MLIVLLFQLLIRIKERVISSLCKAIFHRPSTQTQTIAVYVGWFLLFTVFTPGYNA